jgi:hypothetical protein
MKVKRLYVSPELIVTMLTTGYTLNAELSVAEGLPVGATLVGVGYDLNRRAWGLDFQHPDFAWVPEGCAPNELSVVIQKKQVLLTDALSE